MAPPHTLLLVLCHQILQIKALFNQSLLKAHGIEGNGGKQRLKSINSASLLLLSPLGLCGSMVMPGDHAHVQPGVYYAHVRAACLPGHPASVATVALVIRAVPLSEQVGGTTCSHPGRAKGLAAVYILPPFTG